jgi:hypothetical protein
MEMECKIILLPIDQCTCHCKNVNQESPATETLLNIYFFKDKVQGSRKGKTIINCIKREELSLKTNKKMETETVDLRFKMDCRS